MNLVTGEYGVGFGSMLAVRGEGMLSWVGDDNFVVEDKATANHEVIFFFLTMLISYKFSNRI